MDIDWSKAPEDATHYDPSDDGLEMHWVKLSEGRFYCWEDNIGWHGPLDPNDGFFGGGNVNRIIPRPTKSAAPEPAKNPAARICPAGCGCLWRDNGNGTMSLYAPESVSCDECEEMTWNELKPVYGDEVAAPEWDEAGDFPPVGERVDACVYGDWQELVVCGYGNRFCIGINEDGEDIVFEFNDSTFRLIRAAEQRQRDELEYLIESAYATNGVKGVADAMESSYNLEPKDA